MMGWALSGALLGTLLAATLFAPAAWLARQVTQASEGRVQLADAHGTVWQGDAVLVLTGGPDSRSASALPGRLQWQTGWSASGGMALTLRLAQDCCLPQPLQLRIEPGWGRLGLTLSPLGAAGAPVTSASPGSPAALPGAALPLLGRWPASWLEGLGTPWNTLQPSGSLQLSAQALSLLQVQGRIVLGGQAEIVLSDLASRVSTLETLGDYRLDLRGDPAGDAASLELSTLRGALQLSGRGQWVASKLRFRGQASAAAGFEAALNNLLNIIGRRQGALSVISIG